MKSFLYCLVLSLPLIACGGSDPLPVPDADRLDIDFNQGINDWRAGFADYPAGQESFYELSSSHATLPTSLGTNRKGFRVSGNNHSDDLFMFITKKVSGLEPNTRYDFEFELVFGTDAQKNCMGVGGAPGESVYIKAGISKTEPLAVNNGSGTYLMNIDKGNQAIGGSDAIVIGDFANSRECGDPNTSYMKKTLRSERGAFSAFTANDGSIWVIFGTDSGYEATTTIYFMSATVWASKR
jgi:hypothetical protein